MTVRDLCAAALKVIGVVGKGASMDDTDAADALESLIGLLDTLNADRLCIGTTARTTYTWPVNTSSRTIGPAGQLVGPRPSWVDAWSVIPVGATTEDGARAPLTRGEYENIPDKARTADVFTDLRYEPTPTSGLLTVYPVPTTAPTLVLYVPVALETDIDLNDALSFAPGYREFAQYSLAKRLAGHFKQAWTREHGEILRGASLRVTRANVRVEPRRNDPTLVGMSGSARDIDRGFV